MPSTTCASCARHELGDLGRDRVPEAFVVALAHQAVLRAHLDVGVADQRSCCGAVRGELEHGGVERGVLRPEAVVAPGAAGLVIGDDDRAGSGAVDPIDGAGQVDRAAADERQLDRVVRVVGRTAARRRSPCCRAASTARCRVRARRAGRRAYGRARRPSTRCVPVRPRRSASRHSSSKIEVSASRCSAVQPSMARLRQIACDHGSVEPVECGVLGGADVARGDADLVGGFVDG